MKLFKQLHIVFLILSLSGWFVCGCATGEKSQRRTPVSVSEQPRKSALAPVYAPLAEWLTDRYGLADKEWIGIDLGSGRGDLIVELAQRTPKMHWINADINAARFEAFFDRAKAAQVTGRISAQFADAKNMPYRDGYADIVVSRGSFPFWGGIKEGLSEVNRILKPGGAAFIGRGFSENLPVDIARSIRERQRTSKRFPHYDVDETEKEVRQILDELGIQDYTIHRPKPEGSEGVNYGIWMEWRKK